MEPLLTDRKVVCINTPSPTDTDRRTATLDAAVESFDKPGYYGMSLQRITTEVRLTKTGALHYVGSKEGPLKLALTEECDRVTESINVAMIAQECPLIMDIQRQVMAMNNERPTLVYMSSTLNIETLDPVRPTHDYFADRECHMVTMALNINWTVPEGVNVEHVLQAGSSMMDDLQLRQLRTPGQNLDTIWVGYEDVLMPLSLWDRYR